MKTIPLTQNKVAVVDDDIYPMLRQYKWYYHSTGYAFTNESYRKDQKYRMHHAVLPRLPRHEVDHINGDKLDNRRENLRYTTRIQNAYNRDKQSNNTSGYKGVVWAEWCQKWATRITFNGDKKSQELRVGYYDDILDAANAYNTAAYIYHGDYATYNILPTDYFVA